MKTKSRCFTIVLYPDCNNDIETLEYIKKYYDYAYILHDKDIFLKNIYDENNNLIYKAGEKKKPHFHVLFYFSNPRSISKIKEELHIDYIEPSNFYSMCRYLIHLDNKNKAQYNICEIVTNIEYRVFQCLNKEINYNSYDSKLLLNYIKDSQYSLTFIQLTDFALENDCIYELKKNCYFYKSFCAF